jgi:hypothetical protein
MTALSRQERELRRFFQQLQQTGREGSPIYGVRRDQTARDAPFRQRFTEQSIRLGVQAAGARTTLATRTASIGLGYGVSVVGKDIMQQVATAVTGRTLDVVNDYMRETQRQINRRAGLERMHEEVAQGAKRAMLQSYHGQVNRTNNRYRPQARLTGRLLPALEAMVPEVSRDSINLLDTAYLDRIAAHWRRLNYGTEGSIGQKPVPAFPLRFAEGSAGSLMDRTRPRPGFTMPPGFFVGPNGRIVPFSGARAGSDQFFLHAQNPGVEQTAAEDADFFNTRPKRLKLGLPPLPVERFLPGKGRKSRGIRGYRFTDSGLRYLAREYPNRLLTVAEQWFLESQRAIQPVETTVHPS